MSLASLGFIELVLLSQDSSIVWVYMLFIFAIIGSIILAYMIAKVVTIGLVAIGATVGFFICIFLNYLIFWRIESVPPQVS